MSFLLELFQGLDARSIHYAVLRNYQGLPDHCSSRDIDIVIEKKNFKVAHVVATILAKQHDYKLVLVFKSERFNTLIFGNVEQNDLVQLDFFFHCTLHGIILLDAREMLTDRVQENGVWHVNSQVEFLDKFLFNVLLGQQYPEKYATQRAAAQNDPRVSAALKKIIGKASIREVEQGASSKMRFRALMGSLICHPAAQLGNLFAFLGTNLSNWFWPQGISIGFSGPDGVGKTTVLEKVASELKQTFSEVHIQHFRPNLVPNLGDAMHNAGLKKEVDHDYARPHRGKSTGKISSLVRLCYYIYDYILGYFIKIRPLLYRRNVMIFDRYYTDILTDGRRSKINLPQKFIFRMKLFVPSLHYNFLITAPDEVILSRKKELDVDGIRAIQKNMDFLAGKKGYYLIDNSGTPEQAVQKILTIVYDNQDKRYFRS